jgi:hypothetical protein
MNVRLGFALVVCLVVAPWVVAGETASGQAWNRHQGLYVEGSVGTGFSYLGIMTSEDTPVDAGFTGFTWVGAVGYRFTAHHAIEAGFGQWFATFEDETTVGYDEEGNRITRTEENSAQLNVPYLAWRGTVPIKDRFAFFGKLGVTGAIVTNKEEDTAWLAIPFTGLGFSYAVTPQIDVSIQYQGAIYVLASAGALTAGVAYHF